MKHTSSLAFLVTTNMFKVLPLLLVFTGIVCAFQDVVFPKDDVGKSENLTTRYQEKPPGTTSHVRLELYTNRWKTRPERAAVSPSVQECPTKRGSLHYDERHKCPAIFCQHVSYRCDAQRSGQETGIDYELHNCTGTHRCSYERNIPENNIPISQVCDGVSQCPGSNDDEFSCAKPCQPFCMCIGLTINCSNKPQSCGRFTFENNSIVTKKGDRLYPQLSYLSYLVITDLLNFDGIFVTGLNNLKFLDLSNNKLSTLTGKVFSGLAVLDTLDLAFNQIQVLPDYVFKGLPVLTNLRLCNNQLYVFSDKVFSGLPLLHLLDLSNNQIEVLPDTLFNGLPALTLLSMENNKITALPEDVFNELSILDSLSLSHNQITVLSEHVFSGLSALLQLFLSHNQITFLPSKVFCGLSLLIRLDLSNNKIVVLPDNIFSGLSELSTIDLANNLLLVLPGTVFSGLSNLVDLNLSNNKITFLPKNVFSYDTLALRFLRIRDNNLSVLPLVPFSLEVLDIKNNLITHLPGGTFTNNSKLSILNIIGNNLDVNDYLFEGLDNLTLLLTDTPFMCCAKPKSVTDDKCLSTSADVFLCWRGHGTCRSENDAISSCHALIGSNILRVFLWLIGMCALIGNVAVICYRLSFDRNNITKSYSIFILNLGLSDLLMGIYLMIIGVVDAYFNGVYAWNDQKWRRSVLCTTAGILSSISSEMSTFLILLVTVDRLIVIVFPMARHYQRNISAKQASIISGFLWLVSITIAAIPIISLQSYFKGEFYSQSGVCLALPLTTAEQPGAEYSFAMFVCLNSFIFVVIVICQICIFINMRISGGNITSSQTRKRDMNVAKTLFFVVATDFCCWFPIGVLGVATKYGVQVPNGVYAWVMVFVLPVNAAVNPLLYTVSEVWRRRRRVNQSSSSHPWCNVLDTTQLLTK
ncbi:relaxin receptor 2-like isoform X1 [Mizuhopecten yessoensis]|uniref:relaxin receptor 2-like isoform X1 n=1 Tax=Mizuhopecten yessoensis TaxID=6573 RepID=UPI000B45CED8|nr:relaxin receptor 2-like isoform X1 [Mizuhopecten yessoensis]